jgi:biopolymer transport protein ExbD
MSASFGQENSGEVELNIAPIVDCLTVLIAYMLVSASFIMMAVLDVGVAASGDAIPQLTQPEQPKEPPLSLTVTVAADKRIGLKLTGGRNNVEEEYVITAKADGNWDGGLIKTKLDEIRQLHPQEKLEEANVNAVDETEYKDIVQVVQALKKGLKKVYLAG